MAPIPATEKTTNYHLASSIARIRSRDLASLDSTLVAPLVFLTLLAIMLLACIMYLIVKAWSCVFRPKDRKPSIGLDPARRLSRWAGKHSDVIWAAYIEDDDLRSHFSLSTKSRFSLESLASVNLGRCPLDQSETFSATESTMQPVVNEAASQETCSVEEEKRQAQVTIKDLGYSNNYSSRRTMSQPFSKQYRDGVERVRIRKPSLPCPEIQNKNQGRGRWSLMLPETGYRRLSSFCHKIGQA